MSWYSELFQAASDAYSSRQDALGDASKADADKADAATASKKEVDWTIVGGVAVAVLLVFLLVIRRK